jgi:DNA-binding winged helix-turn-helix (wHTH) protein/Tol biopolymer transport system component
MGPADSEHGYEFGPFRLDVVRRRLLRGDQQVPLTPRSFDTLLALVSCAGRLVEKDELMRVVWSDTSVVDDNLTQQISSLRKTLGDHSDEPTYILTIPRRGYRFLAPVRILPAGPISPGNGFAELSSHSTASVSAHADALASSPPAPAPERIAARPALSSRWFAAAVVGSALVTLAATLALTGWRRDAMPPAVRFAVTPPDDVALLSGGVISPDGRWLVYVGGDLSGRSMLMLRALEAGEAKPIAGTRGASAPFWSPDNRFIGFFGDNDLKTVDVSGDAAVRTLVSSFPTRGGGRGGATWSRDGVILYAPSRLTELYSVPASGGTPRAVTSLAPGEIAHLWPQFLPDGRHFLYSSLRRRPEAGVVSVGSLDSPDRRVVLGSASRAVFAPPGYLLFAESGSLRAQRFDTRLYRLEDVPRTVTALSNLDDVMLSAAMDQTVTITGVNNPSRELAWYDRGGRPVSTVTSESVLAPALSPDERRVAGEHQGEIWLVDLPQGNTSRFILGPDSVTSPLWSPDGNRIAVASQRAIYTKAANESGREEILGENIPGQPVLYDWSSDGRFILFSTRTPDTQWDLWLLPVNRSEAPRPFLRTAFTEYQARISPNGRQVAYVSDESSTLEVYVDAFPSRAHKQRVSVAGGMHPSWRGDSRELFFLAPDKKLMAAQIDLDTERVQAPRSLFQTRIAGVARNHYTVSGDGQRFLINSPVSEAAISPITVILNWTSLLH